eukprot:3132704-Ditylum_brightwellii.AAC.1
MSDDEGDKSLDEFESVNEELSAESEIVDVSDLSLSSESSSPSELDKERLFDVDNVELMVNPVGDIECYSDDENEVSDYAYFNTIGGDLAEDHETKRKSGNYINSYVLINSGGIDLMRKKNELS